VQHNGRFHEPSSKVNTLKKDYWQLAAQKLQEEDPSTEAQIKALRAAAADKASETDLAAQLLHATKQSQAALESKRWKITVSSREIELHKQFERLVKAITLIKDVGNAAASLDPVHAGLPFAGFCLLMQVCPLYPTQPFSSILR
jgi:hypothetical protein